MPLGLESISWCDCKGSWRPGGGDNLMAWPLRTGPLSLKPWWSQKDWVPSCARGHHPYPQYQSGHRFSPAPFIGHPWELPQSNLCRWDCKTPYCPYWQGEGRASAERLLGVLWCQHLSTPGLACSVPGTLTTLLFPSAPEVPPPVPSCACPVCNRAPFPP